MDKRKTEKVDMQGFLKAITDFLVNGESLRFRDRRAHYASSGLQCLRDQYWKATGEEPTNEIDLIGRLKMAMGNAVEQYFMSSVFNQLHRAGYALLGTQIPVGTSEPNIDGYLDALVEKEIDGEWKKFVVEVKTKSGYGADLFNINFCPSNEYLSQLGLYLRDLHNKGITQHGMLFYVLLSDKNFGTLVQIDCVYDPDTDEIIAYRGESSTGIVKNLDYRYTVCHTINRYLRLDECLKNEQVPEPDYFYKYPVDSESLRDEQRWSDRQIKSVLSGQNVGGDWQPRYSQYFRKQLQVDKLEPKRTPRELALLWLEYKRRHSRSKLETFIKDRELYSLVMAEVSQIGEAFRKTGEK